MATIYLVGDWTVSCGPVFAETPLGYNQTRPRAGCEVLVTVKETGDPLVAAG